MLLEMLIKAAEPNYNKCIITAASMSKTPVKMDA